VHNAGEVWASMLWEAYVALQKARDPDEPFDDVRRRMADYIVAGLEMSPIDATYTEQRDAILGAAAGARHEAGGDLLTLATAFARRGAGTCAVSPPHDSVNFAGVVESFEVQPRIALGQVRLAEEKSCDLDGVLDAGERGTIVVPVINGGPVEMRNTTVTVTTSTPGISFKDGNSAHVEKVAPFSSVNARIEIEIDRSFTGIGQLTLNVSASNGEGCEPTVARTANFWVNVDDMPGASNIDTVESPSSPWIAAGANAAEVWSRVEVTPFNSAWLGRDLGMISDTTLTSPDLHVGTTGPLVIAFDHRFGFETNGGVAPFFDGG
jgi:hypothetical protein